jgi:hypothetical protein
MGPELCERHSPPDAEQVTHPHAHTCGVSIRKETPAAARAPTVGYSYSVLSAPAPVTPGPRVLGAGSGGGACRHAAL